MNFDFQLLITLKSLIKFSTGYNSNNNPIKILFTLPFLVFKMLNLSILSNDKTASTNIIGNSKSYSLSIIIFVSVKCLHETNLQFIKIQSSNNAPSKHEPLKLQP